MNKKHLHFWRLDAIWGCRPNNKPVTAVETLQTSSTPAFLLPASGAATTTVTTTATASASTSEDSGDAASSEQEKLRGARATLSPINLRSDDYSDAIGNDAQEESTNRNAGKLKACKTPIATQCGGQLKVPDRLGAGEGLKRLLEINEARKEARDEKRIKAREAGEEKRMKIEVDVQMHRIECEGATAERIAEIQARSNEKMVEMQQETMRMQMQMMEGFFKIMQGRDNA